MTIKHKVLRLCLHSNVSCRLSSLLLRDVFMIFNLRKIINFNTLLNIYNIWKFYNSSKQFMNTKEKKWYVKIIWKEGRKPCQLQSSK
jgi:hypothetical protein